MTNTATTTRTADLLAPGVGTFDIVALSAEVRNACRVAREATDAADALSARGSGSRDDVALEHTFRRLAIIATDKARLLADDLEAAAARSMLVASL